MKTNPNFDFSHLSPEERIDLAEDLWDSLGPDQLPVTPDLARKLEERLRRYRASPLGARPLEEVLGDLEERGR